MSTGDAAPVPAGFPCDADCGRVAQYGVKGGPTYEDFYVCHPCYLTAQQVSYWNTFERWPQIWAHINDRRATAQQAARVEKYRIAAKPSGHRTKPEAVKGCPDDNFIDPVNYFLPITEEADVATALSRWLAFDDKLGTYTAEEIAIINRRLEEAHVQYGLTPPSGLILTAP